MSRTRGALGASLLLLFAAGGACSERKAAESDTADVEAYGCEFPCVVENEHGSFVFSIDPSTADVMKELLFTVEIPSDMALEGPLKLSLQMKAMYMGENTIKLGARGDGKFQAIGYIPACSSGKTEWYADLMMEGEKLARFPFNVRY